MDLRAYLRHLDYTLLFAALCLIGYGVAMIFFATGNDVEGDALAYARPQVVNALAGLVLLGIVSLIDYEVYRRWQWALYAFTVVSIAAVYVVGSVTRGSRRWIELPFFNLQPSQLGLFLVTLALGAFLVDRMDLLGTRRITLLALAYVALPAALVFFQPDFGTSTVYVALVLALLFFYGTPWTHFAAIVGVGIAAFVLLIGVLPLAGLEVVKPYQVDRLLVFLDPGRDPGDTGYNVTQSMIAVGSGALTGRGEQATQTTLDFLPEHHTDFIFSVIGERFGFLGALALLALYALLLWRALRIATLSRDMYGSMLAGGVAAMLLFQIFVNIGMTIGIMPVTGIPLPFISYGGAAMITFLLFIGLLESVHVRAMTESTPGVSVGRP